MKMRLGLYASIYLPLLRHLKLPFASQVWVPWKALERNHLRHTSEVYLRKANLELLVVYMLYKFAVVQRLAKVSTRKTISMVSC